MRYLWIEDFNDGSFVEDELKERLENFFDLKNDKLIVKKDLSSAILFLEEKENLHEIDAFLIDIRFPEGKIEKLYEKYFSPPKNPVLADYLGISPLFGEIRHFK